MKYLFFFFVPLYGLWGQAKIEHQSQIWYGYYLTYSINQKLYIQGEVHKRHFVDPCEHHQYAFRAHMHRSIGEAWELSTGAAVFLNTPNNPLATIRLAIPEYRPHVEISYKHQFSMFRIDHRFRSEMRFNQGIDVAKTNLTDEIKFSNYRFRYRIQALFPLIKSIQGKINTEVLINAAQENPDNVLDQHRMFAGLSIPILSNLTIDLGYLHAFQQRSNLDFYDRSILSLMVYHRIK